jgi:hypothetical protein
MKRPLVQGVTGESPFSKADRWRATIGDAMGVKGHRKKKAAARRSERNPCDIILCLLSKKSKISSSDYHRTREGIFEIEMNQLLAFFPSLPSPAHKHTP